MLVQHTFIQNHFNFTYNYSAMFLIVLKKNDLRQCKLLHIKTVVNSYDGCSRFEVFENHVYHYVILKVLT